LKRYMTESDLKQLEQMKAKTLAGMINYMNYRAKDASAPYTDKDVEECDNVLGEFIGALQNMGLEADQPEILECVKKVVLELNKLNDRTGGCLIETGQREELFTYIDFAARQSGLTSTDADVTEEWREW